MKNTMKRGVLALTLLGSVALLTAPAVANSIHDEGDFGGGYRIIGPSGGPERYAYVGHHTFRAYYYGPTYSYGYGPGWGGPASTTIRLAQESDFGVRVLESELATNC